ncbi:MAG: hypothetical protein P1P89_10225 [Desulfobacterales bacterium]|nr:hypothetical protein [Desulfobacterales bacterium]
MKLEGAKRFFKYIAGKGEVCARGEVVAVQLTVKMMSALMHKGE